MYSAANGLSLGPTLRRGGAYCIMECGIFWTVSCLFSQGWCLLYIEMWHIWANLACISRSILAGVV